MKSLAKSAAATACLGAALLFAVPGTASAIIQNGATATITADGNNVRVDFNTVTTSSGATAVCGIKQLSPSAENGPTVTANPLGPATVNWPRPNGNLSLQAVCRDPGDNQERVLLTKDVTLPAVAPAPGTPGTPAPAKPFWCAIGVPTGSAGC